MSSPEQYTPRGYSELDWISAAKRTADAIVRSNPLTNAVISNGLTQWRGNHTNPDGSKVEFMWIGDFFPADTTFVPSKPQKGIVFRRDDSSAAVNPPGSYAFALYDAFPGAAGLGLRQTIHWQSVDTKRLNEESRDGGQRWPQENVYMGPIPRAFTEWVATPVTPDNAWWTLWEGRANILGNNLVSRYWAAGTGGAATEFRTLVEGGSGDIVGTTHALGVNVDFVFDDTLNVATERGQTRVVRLQARTTNTTGRARIQCISVRSFTP